ncbi:MAG: PEP-CTERM sorting domain-containing protein [Chthoniobacterales bacterium]
MSLKIQTLKVIKTFTQIVALGTISLLAMASAQANSITTLFGSNNNGSAGGAVYFDITVASSALSITAFDLNTSSTAPFSNLQVWLLPGMTSQGNEINMSLWTEVATGSGTGAGQNNPTHVTLSNSFALSAGTLYGIALVADPSFSHFYTNGDGTNQNYSNADLSLSLGSATNVPFTAPVFSPRVWNGTVYYDVVPEPSTLALLGCGVLGLIGCARRSARQSRRV